MGQLSFGKKLSYSMGGIALNLANLAISQWLLVLYVPTKDKALVASLLFSLIFLAGRITDGITEPLIGFLSDHWRSKRGRRIPFIIFATLPVAAVSFLLWTPPLPHEQSWINGVYIFVLVQLFFILWSTLANPYMSLLPELTSDLKERVDISAMQAVFLMIGTLIFGFLGPIKEAFGWIGIGSVLFIATIVSFLPTILVIKQRPSDVRRGADERFCFMMIFSWAATTFKNRAFIRYLAATALFWFALNLFIIIVPFWSKYVLGNTDDKVVLLMAPLLAANLVFFFVFSVLSKKFGKYVMFLVTLAGCAAAMSLLWFVGPALPASPQVQTQVVMGLVGVFMAGFMMLPMALLADVIDYDETLTGKRREGIYFGMQSILQKISIGVSIPLAAALMYAGGGMTPTELGLKLIALVAGFFALLACAVFLTYPLREREGKVFVKGR
jgi:GPH family glycoside/pentoside/hexuronide:cation symporter